jgi:hypothetical protein
MATVISELERAAKEFAMASSTCDHLQKKLDDAVSKFDKHQAAVKFNEAYATYIRAQAALEKVAISLGYAEEVG